MVNQLTIFWVASFLANLEPPKTIKNHLERLHDYTTCPDADRRGTTFVALGPKSAGNRDRWTIPINRGPFFCSMYGVKLWRSLAKLFFGFGIGENLRPKNTIRMAFLRQIHSFRFYHTPAASGEMNVQASSLIHPKKSETSINTPKKQKTPVISNILQKNMRATYATQNISRLSRQETPNSVLEGVHVSNQKFDT